MEFPEFTLAELEQHFCEKNTLRGVRVWFS